MILTSSELVLATPGLATPSSTSWWLTGWSSWRQMEPRTSSWHLLLGSSDDGCNSVVKKTCHWQSVFFLHGFTGAWCFLGLSSNETSLGSNERIPWYSVVSKHQSYLPGLVPFCEEAGTGPGHCIRLKFWHWFKVLTLMLSMVQSFDICHQKLCRLLMHFLRSMIPRFDIDHKNSCSHGRIDAEHDSQSHDNSGLGRGLHTPIPSWRKRSLIAYHVAWFFWHWHSKWSSVIWFWLVEFWIDMPSWWNDFLKLEPWLKSH